MISLNTLKDTHRKRRAVKRVGRGIGSKRGKTCGRGEKGAGSRSGYKHRWGKEGGNLPLFMKLPIRGFSNARFSKPLDCVNLEQIEALYSDGEVVNAKTLKEKGFIGGRSYGVKILGKGELTKKVKIEADSVSAGAKEKLHNAKIQIMVAS